MADIIDVDPDHLRAAATRHNDTADELRAIPRTHEAIQASLDSLGPIFADLREAGRSLLEQRELCYRRQAEDHTHLAEVLSASATALEEEAGIGAAQIRAVLDEH